MYLRRKDVVSVNATNILIVYYLYKKSPNTNVAYSVAFIFVTLDVFF